MPSPAELFLSLLIGSIASGYLLYGRRQSSPPALVAGLALMLLPFFVSGMGLQIGLALPLMVMPFLLRRR